MPNVQVDYEQLRSSAAQLRTGQQEVEAQLARLQGNITNLVSSGFVTDRASGKFRDSYEQWNTGAKNVIAGLEGMSRFLDQAIQQHEQLDTQLSQGVGG